MSALADLGDALPYQPRTLRLRELQKQPVYSFFSPKCKRFVRVVGLPRLAVVLEIEFDPTVEVYVERPRTLRVDEEEEVEFSYWHRHRGGRERLTLVVCAPDTVLASGGRHQHRRAEALLAAAEVAKLPLRFVVEADLPQRSARVTNQFRLLPSVQAAHQLPSRQPLRQRILEVVSSRERVRIEQIEQQLEAFCPADVSCGVADLLHAGEVGVDLDKLIGPSTLVWRATQ